MLRKILATAAVVTTIVAVTATAAQADTRPAISYIDFHGSWIAVHGTNIWPGVIQIRSADGSGRLMGGCGTDNSHGGAVCGVQSNTAFGQILAVPMDPHAPPGRYAVTATNFAIGNNVSAPFFFGIGVPTNIEPPRVLKRHPAVGVVARATPGTWSVANGSAYHASAVWESCGAVCHDVATGWSYVPTWGDLNNRLRVRVTMTDDHATGGPVESAFTFAVTPPPPPAPKNITVPTLSIATPRVGATETATTGSWSNNPTAFHYRWVMCGLECHNVGGDVPTYTLRAVDAGKKLHVVVTASNAGGSATARSAATAKVVR